MVSESPTRPLALLLTLIATAVPGLVRAQTPTEEPVLRVHHRLLRTRSFRVWDAVTCAC